MKTSVLRIACLAVICILMSGFVANAQDRFYDTKWESGKVVSKTMFDMGDYGMYEPKFEIKYAYDENGNFMKKEVCVWNPKYVWNYKTGRWDPDYSEANWTPQYCIKQKEDLVNNFIYAELLLWNKKEKIYNAPMETMIYQLKDANHFNYLAFSKNNKYIEVTNNINYDSGLLARITK